MKCKPPHKALKGYPLHQLDTAASAEFLAVTMDQEVYRPDILKVQEIRRYEAVTTLANAPDYFKGVINLRGVIVPIIDMRIRFNLGTPTYDQFTIVIVLNLGGAVMGMVVDSVSDVITLAPGQICPARHRTGAKACRMRFQKITYNDHRRNNVQ